MSHADLHGMELLEDLTVYDVEIHSSEKYPELVEYVKPDSFREEQEAGYRFGPEEWGPIPWDGWDRTAGGRINFDGSGVPDAEGFAGTREDFRIDKAIFSPGGGFKIFQIPDHDVRLAFMRAMNRFTMDKLVRDDDTNYGKVHVVPDHPRESAEEIEKYADEEGMVGAFFANMLDYPFGHERYEPVWEALEAADMPVFLHGESSVYAGFPTDRLRYSKYVEVHTVVHPFLQIWHATSIIGQEIPERYDVDVCFLEAGQSWIQMLQHRMNREYRERPNDAPGLTKLPSEYLSEFYYGTQPLEEPANEELFGEQVLEANGLEDQIVLTTDYPHMDFDAPMAVAGHEGLTYEQKKKIIQDNPRELLGV